MASSSPHSRAYPLAKDHIKQAFDVSHFEPNAIIRGAQLTLVGVHRALQNPDLFTPKHYKQAIIAVAAGVLIRVAIAVPILGVRVLLWLLSTLFRLDSANWVNGVISNLHFVEEYVLQVPLFLMTLMRYATPAMDNMFMDSLRWVDITYVRKHRNEDPRKLRPMYYDNLGQYGKRDGSTNSSSTAEAISMFLFRFARKGLISLAVFAASFLPLVGPFVLPAASFYTFKQAVGLGPASLIFGTSALLSRRYLVVFLQTYFASRSLTRELLEPYFARIRFTKDEKRNWFRNREGLLFGFGIGFYILLRVPLLGVMIYGLAEASTAYLITKVTEPPPPPAQSAGFAASQQEWRNRKTVLTSALGNLDDALHANQQQPPPPYEANDAKRE